MEREHGTAKKMCRNVCLSKVWGGGGGEYFIQCTIGPLSNLGQWDKAVITYTVINAGHHVDDFFQNYPEIVYFQEVILVQFE